MIKNLIILLIVVLTGCQTTDNKQQIDSWKAEVVSAEKLFAEMAKEKGIAVAFAAFADSNATILRENSILIGIPEIFKFYDLIDFTNVEVNWAPDFVDVSSSGDMAYTYGKYIYTITDSVGSKSERKGIFHTVWKRQKDGSWKYVWD